MGQLAYVSTTRTPLTISLVVVSRECSGSIIYQLERVFKSFWDTCCWWCCFKCCWQRHHGAEHAHSHKDALLSNGVSNPNSRVSGSYSGEGDYDEDRWGNVDFDAAVESEDEDYDAEVEQVRSSPLMPYFPASPTCVQRAQNVDRALHLRFVVSLISVTSQWS